MKKVMFALCFMLGGAVALIAQDTTSNQYRTETQSGDQSQNQDSSQMQDPSQSQYAQGQDQDRERIQSTELPEEVKRSLEGQEYRGWLISGAYKAKGTSDQSSMESDSTSANPNEDATRQDNANATGAMAEEVYIVELKNGAQTKTVRFDKDGEKIEGMDDESQSSENQNNQYNQNNQMDETNKQADPNAADPSSSQSTDETTPNSQSDQSTQSSESTDTQSDTQTDQSTETQTDQSKANEPK